MTSFMKVMGNLLVKLNEDNCTAVFPDLFLSTELIPKRRLKKWIKRQGFRIRKVVILKWIIMGNIITMAYKGLPLSMFIWEGRKADTSKGGCQDLRTRGSGDLKPVNFAEL